MNLKFGYNKRGGGSRGRLSEETKQKMSEVWTDEHKENHSNKIKIKWEDEEYREHMSNLIKERWEDEEYRASVTKAVKARWEDEEYRDKMCNMSKTLAGSEESRNRFSEQMKVYWSDEERRKEQGEKSKLRWEDEEYRKFQCEKRKLVWENEEYRNAQVAERKARWENNEYREKMGKLRSGAGNSRAVKVTVKLNGKYIPFGCKKEAFTEIGVSKDVFNKSIKIGLTPKILKAGVSEIIIGDMIINYTSKENRNM